MHVLEALDIHKTYREAGEPVHVLRGVSLTLDRGEVVALEGPSGSGKTTFLSILGCLLTPSSGKLMIEGQDVDHDHPERLWRFRRDSIGFVFQQFNLFPSLTAAENVEYALNLKGHRGQGARDEAARWLDAVGLSDRRGFRPRDLSGGQKQRVAVAGPWRAGRRSCWPTSPRATSTSRSASRSSTCSATWPGAKIGLC